MRASSSSGSTVFTVTGTGRVRTTALEITGGGDLVEAFESDEVCEPGSVVVIDAANPGRLKVSTTAYDARVAGAVSGAGGEFLFAAAAEHHLARWPPEHGHRRPACRKAGRHGRHRAAGG